MAIYHLSAAPISRSQGRSSVASAAYRAGEKLYDERQEMTFNYGRKQDVLYKEILLPKGAPEWMLDRGKLWNYVESIEKRKDAQLAREIHFSLPRELSEEQNIELAKEFVQNEFVARGMVVDLCVHGGKGKDGEEQPHAHVMLSLREAMEEGFGLKERSWNAKENLMLWRESWAEHANKYLALNGIDQRIDHRSLEERGIDLEPQNKIGSENLRIHEQKVMEHNKIARNNGEKILEDPLIALKAITYHQSTFTHHELARFINRHTVDEDQFRVVYEKVKNSPEIVFLGQDERGRERFSTREMVKLEQRMMRDVGVLESRGEGSVRNKEGEVEESKEKSVIAEAVKSNVAEGIVLSNQQREALEYIMGDGDIKCLVGYAGTGKSCLLDKAREIWEKEGYRVQGVTLAGIAAENLEYSSGIESRTFASREYYWDKGEEKLGKKDILVVDEAGMLGSRQVARIVEEVKKGGAKVIPIGDPQQLQSIEAGAALRAIIEKTGYSELTEIRRQTELWQQEATKEFASKHTADALSLYEQNGYVHCFATQADAKEALVSKWNNERFEHPEKSQIMLSYTRRDVGDLNEMARDYRKGKDELGEDQKLEVAGGVKDFAIGDRIYFLQNNRDMGVKNGTLGTIENIDGLSITVNVDGKREEQKRVTFSLDRYNHITHGYAATIHKAQGVTVDRSYILASQYMDSHAAYVGMSRHREKAELFWSKEEFANKQELEQVLGRDRSKDVTVDYLGMDIENLERMQDDNFVKGNKTGIPEEIKKVVKEPAAQEHILEAREINKKTEQDAGSIGYRQKIKELGREKSKEKDRGKGEVQKPLDSQKSKLYVKTEEKVDTSDVSFLHEILGREEAEKHLKKRGHEDVLIEYKKEEQAKAKRLEKEEENRAELLINKYFGLDSVYDELKKQKGLPYAKELLRKQLDICARKIGNNKYAMNYLKEERAGLYTDISKLMERSSGVKQALSSEDRLDKIIKECGVNVLSIKSYNWKQARYIEEGTYSPHVESCLDECKNEIRQCIKDYGDEEVLWELKQQDHKLFKGINEASDGAINKVFEKVDSRERLKALAEGDENLYKRTLHMEEDYRRLDREFVDIDKGITEMVKAGYRGEYLKEPKEMLEAVKTDLNKCANSICKDIQVIWLIGKHDTELFRNMNNDFSDKFTKELKKHYAKGQEYSAREGSAMQKGNREIGEKSYGRSFEKMKDMELER